MNSFLKDNLIKIITEQPVLFVLGIVAWAFLITGVVTDLLTFILVL